MWERTRGVVWSMQTQSLGSALHLKKKKIKREEAGPEILLMIIMTHAKRCQRLQTTDILTRSCRGRQKKILRTTSSGSWSHEMSAEGKRKGKRLSWSHVKALILNIRKASAPTWWGVFPPWSPAKNKLIAVILLPLAEEPLLLARWCELQDEICWGALSVQALAKNASGLAFPGLSQHGVLQTKAGTILQWDTVGSRG